MMPAALAWIAAAVVRVLLTLAPAPFRTRFGGIVADEIRADLKAATARGLAATARASGGAVLDAARGVAAERLQQCRGLAAAGKDVVMFTGLLSDSRMAWRGVRGRPWLTAIVVATLGIAVGAATAMFSVADAVLLRPLPFPDSARLVTLEEATATAGRRGASLPAIGIWSGEAEALESVAYYEASRSLVIVGDQPDRLEGGMFSRNYFEVLRVSPALGRGFSPGPEFEGPDEVVISDRLWRRLGGDASVVGRTLVIDPRPFVVVGVMPPGFDYPAGADFWTSMPKDLGRIAASRQLRFMTAIGRLKPGASLAALQAQLAVLTDRYPHHDRVGGAVRMVAAGLHDAAVAHVRPAIAIVVCAAILLLVIASINVAALLLAQATSRRRERSVQAALGATGARLVRQGALEVLIVALAGGAIGMLAAWASRDLIVALSLDEIPRIAQVRIDARALAFGFLATIAGAALAALLPAWLSDRADAVAGLRGESRGSGGSPGVLRMLRGLVVVEVAMTMVLAVGGILLARSLENLIRVDRGFAAEDVIAMRVNLPTTPRLGKEASLAFHEEVRRRAPELPGVESAAFASRLPLADALASSEVHVAGGPIEDVQAIVQVASPGYLSTIGARLTEGRDIADEDRAGAPVAVINDVLARRLFGDVSPVGRRVIFQFMTGPVEVEVVGVARPIRYNGLAGAPAPELYVDYRARIVPMMLFTRVSAPAARMIPELTRIIRDVDPTGRATVDQVTTLEREVNRRLARPRFFLALVGTFGAVALVLVTAGLYGVMAFAVAQRRHEMGVRLALGASPRQLFREVIGRGAVLAGMGLLAGLIASAAAAGVLRSLLFGVGPWDPVTFAVAMLVVLLVTITASWLPARRAQRTDPLEVLRTN
jgi:putative ABC transport system permease protein